MFYDGLTQFSNNVAAIEGQKQLSYTELEQACTKLQADLTKQLGAQKQLVFIYAFNGLSTLVAYLSVLRQGYCGMLINPDTPDSVRSKLVTQYQPNASIECGPNQQVKILFDADKTAMGRSQIILLLSTSGSTGSAKQVALSAKNLQANADSICDYLPIKTTDKTLCSLPFYYSYGLSIVNSHLNRGACCVFSDASPVSREYWQLFEEHKINSFAGVPFTYEMLLKLRFNRKKLPYLRYFTQAGGKLAADAVKTLALFAEQNNSPFFVMYGQTEASPRMAFLQPHKVLHKPDSVGQAIPRGNFKLLNNDNLDVVQPNVIGELFYAGPNVMLGYVTSREDMQKLMSKTSQQPNVWLATGDLAYMDEDGDLFITGRKSRFLKLFGQRIDLDEIESLLSQQGVESLCSGDDSHLAVGLIEHSQGQELIDEKAWLSQYLGLHPSVISIVRFDSLPLTANGKKDYQTLLKLALGEGK
jgi:acyl-coenzyme A synthetase/AMP-(fatty) acid ligase